MSPTGERTRRHWGRTAVALFSACLVAGRRHELPRDENHQGGRHTRRRDHQWQHSGERESGALQPFAFSGAAALGGAQRYQHSPDRRAHGRHRGGCTGHHRRRCD